MYHSHKYKKPLYDTNAINEHLISVLGVDNTPKLFYRWERPVRYYLEVPPEYPQLAKQFEVQVAQVARHTGLDIKRHDKPYLEYKDPKRNDKSQWPDGLSTNVMFIITNDVTKTVQDPLVSELLKGLGVTTEKALAEWEYVEKIKTNIADNESLRYGVDPDGMKFTLAISKPRRSITSRNPQSLRESFAQTVFGSLTVVFNTKDRLFKPDSTLVSELNQQLLRVLYGPHVHSGMLLIKAKRLMMEELVDCFNAKGA